MEGEDDTLFVEVTRFERAVQDFDPTVQLQTFVTLAKRLLQADQTLETTFCEATFCLVDDLVLKQCYTQPNQRNERADFNALAKAGRLRPYQFYLDFGRPSRYFTSSLRQLIEALPSEFPYSTLRFALMQARAERSRKRGARRAPANSWRPTEVDDAEDILVQQGVNVWPSRPERRANSLMRASNDVVQIVEDPTAWSAAVQVVEKDLEDQTSTHNYLTVDEEGQSVEGEDQSVESGDEDYTSASIEVGRGLYLPPNEHRHDSPLWLGDDLLDNTFHFGAQNEADLSMINENAMSIEPMTASKSRQHTSVRAVRKRAASGATPAALDLPYSRKKARMDRPCKLPTCRNCEVTVEGEAERPLVPGSIDGGGDFPISAGLASPHRSTNELAHSASSLPTSTPPPGWQPVVGYGSVEGDTSQSSCRVRDRFDGNQAAADAISVISDVEHSELLDDGKAARLYASVQLGQMINDDAFMAIINCLTPSSCDWLVLNTHFVHCSEKSRRKQLDHLRQGQTLVVPLHVDDVHWTVAMVSPADSHIEIYDPLQQSSTIQKCRELLDARLLWLLDTLEVAGAEQWTESRGWSYTAPYLLKQNDGYSCGILCLLIASCRMNGMPAPTIASASTCRRIFSAALCTYCNLDCNEHPLPEVSWPRASPARRSLTNLDTCEIARNPVFALQLATRAFEHDRRVKKLRISALETTLSTCSLIETMVRRLHRGETRAFARLLPELKPHLPQLQFTGAVTSMKVSALSAMKDIIAADIVEYKVERQKLRAEWERSNRELARLAREFQYKISA